MSGQLFDLCKSLSTTEKRQFGYFAKRYRQSPQYLKLFDFYCRQSDFDKYEERAFTHKASLKFPRQLKQQLKQRILLFLEEQYKQLDASTSLDQMIHQVKILFHKGLLKSADKLLQRAKRMAYEGEHFEKALTLLNIEGKISIQQGRVREKEILQEEIRIAELIRLNFSYRDLHHRLMELFLERGIARNAEDRRAYANSLQHPLLRIESKAQTRSSKIYLNYLKQFAFGMMGQLSKSETYGQRNYKIVQDSGMHIPPNIDVLLRALLNLMNIYLRKPQSKELENLWTTVDHLLQKAELPLGLRISFESGLWGNRLYSHSIRGEFNKGVALIEEAWQAIESKLALVRPDLLMIYYFHFAFLNFGYGRWEEALNWLDKILEFKNKKIRSDILINAWILSMLSHFEMGNRALLEYQSRSAYRFLLRINRTNTLERRLLKFIRNDLSLLGRSPDLKTALHKLKTEFEEMEKDPFIKEQFRNLDFVAWLDSKTSERSFSEALKIRWSQKFGESQL